MLKRSLRRLVPHLTFFEHSARTAIAATVSLLVARGFRLPDAYWAPITTLVITQSTLGASWTVSRQRLAGTALGATAGALLVAYLGSGAVVFGASILGIGVICAIPGFDRSAYRFAGITLAIVMLVARTEPAWIVGIHRFIEVSVGIAVGLGVAALWPERQQPA
jgi:uncharacterized membrane protein YgaE (UPF0421/DUF939 family)